MRLLARRGEKTAIRLVVALLATLAADGAAAQAPEPQPPIGLLADDVTFDRDAGLLTAAGNVEVLYQGRVLRASRIVYDERAGTVRATGPIALVDPEGGVLLADAGVLTPDLEEGLIEGARVLIDGRLQLAAVEGRRRGGRFATLDRVVASSCTICAYNPIPTWAIRAARVTQDPVARRIYFENARLEVLGAPVAWAPRLSIPEPGVERASGLLAPEFLSSQIYGFGAKLPYYRVLGPSADATLTPFATSRGGLLFESEYRRRFARGGIELDAVVALDDGLPQSLGGDRPRWFASALGEQALGRGFVAEVDAGAVSDEVFLKQFDYSDADALTSAALIRRTRAEDMLRLAVIGFQSLGPDDPDNLPAILPDFLYRRDLDGRVLGGRASVELASLGVVRKGGESVLRGSGGADWRRDWTLARGVRAAALTSASLDSYRVVDDPEFDEAVLGRATPLAAVELRWPLVRRDGAADQVIEPIVQVVLSENFGDEEIPNEDSLLPELSYANLFSVDRFPGRDRVETGLRANVGVQYVRSAPGGADVGLTFGRILRATDLEQFPDSAGLNGRWSDYVGAVTLDFEWGLSLANRALVDDDLDFSRNEFAVTYEGERGGLGASYIYLAGGDDGLLGNQPETSEIALSARYRVLPNWEVRGAWRFDAVQGSNLRAGGGITYGNECAELDLSVSRRYTSSDNLPPSTTIGFGLRLAGIGASQTREWPPRNCSFAGLQ